MLEGLFVLNVQIQVRQTNISPFQTRKDVESKLKSFENVKRFAQVMVFRGCARHALPCALPFLELHHGISDDFFHIRQLSKQKMHRQINYLV